MVLIKKCHKGGIMQTPYATPGWALASTYCQALLYKQAQAKKRVYLIVFENDSTGSSRVRVIVFSSLGCFSM